jgi:hypothetical protein
MSGVQDALVTAAELDRRALQRLRNQAVTEARGYVCSALAALGAACVRLREIEQGEPMITAESWPDVQKYADEARHALHVLGAIAINAETQEESK